ncbi:hypothetical protein H0H93_016619 [Arthromyces matolae]|nr:hypothetical protein H0H93_016619 [Arthromyces matolae]
MKLFALSLGFWAFASANAQYFSAGWAPGQPIPNPEPTPAKGGIPQDTPVKVAPQRPNPKGISELFDITNILSSSVAVSVFSKFGINITERLESAIEHTKVWDSRVPLITDDNYHELILNEPLNAQEEQDRTWMIVISVTTGRQDGISLMVDQMFDAAFNESIVENDLPNVRWGRIDYFNVTGITTKWSVWNAPYLVVLKDRGRTLRFYRPGQLRLRADALRNFLKNEEWMHTPPWSSVWAPGGEREWIVDYLAFALTKIYNVMVLVPRWLMFILSGSIASVLINLLHKPSRNATPTPGHATKGGEVAPPRSSSETVGNTSATPTSTVAAKRKKTKGKK